MTVKIEYPNGKVETIEKVIKIDSAGLLRRRRHGIDINRMIVERKNGGVAAIHFPEIQYFEIIS